MFQASQIDHIEPMKIQELVNTMSEKYSPETVNKCINILSDIFQFAIQPLKALAAADNPMIGIKRLKVPYKKKVTWTDEQVAAFLNSPVVKANHYYPTFCVSLILGMRPGEVCGFCDDDLINQNHTIMVHRTIDKEGNVDDTKNTNSIRALYLPGVLYDIIGNSPKTFLQTYAHIRRRQSDQAVIAYEEKIFQKL